MTTTQVKNSTVKRALVASTIGSFVEWFDYTAYGYLAVVLGTVFFPSDDPTVQLLSTFGVFAVAFVVRPLGGFFFGQMGDRTGRRRTLAITIFLMSGATCAMGLLPSYASIGIFAPILLLVFRLLQGFSAGGEIGGASAFMAEYSPIKRRGLMLSSVDTASLAAPLLASLTVYLLTANLSQEAMVSWGWRVPFLIAGPIGVIGLYLRLALDDSPNFDALEKSESVSRVPLREAFTRHWRSMLICAGVPIIKAVGIYVILTYLPTYFSEVLNVEKDAAFLSTVISLVVATAVAPLAGALSDRVGRKPVLVAACLALLVLTYPAFLFMSQGGVAQVMLAQILLAVFVGGVYGPNSAVLAELFPTRVRYSGFSIPYNVTVATFGGGGPLLVVYLISVTGNNFMPAFYIIVAAALSLLAVVMTYETAGKPLRE